MGGLRASSEQRRFLDPPAASDTILGAILVTSLTVADGALHLDGGQRHEGVGDHHSRQEHQEERRHDPPSPPTHPRSIVVREDRGPKRDGRQALVVGRRAGVADARGAGRASGEEQLRSGTAQDERAGGAEPPPLEVGTRRAPTGRHAGHIVRGA